jgi:Ca-activated chloride channel homolog
LSSTAVASVTFDERTRAVHVTLAANDALREPSMVRRLEVFEDGQRQTPISVAAEHAPVSIAVLMEMGGRSHELNDLLKFEVPYLVAPLFERLGEPDRLALFTYADKLQTLADFGAPRQAWQKAMHDIRAATFSEANFYEAAEQLLERMKTVSGRRAIIVVTTGIDTFSSISFDDLLQRAREAETPIYALTLGDLVRARLHPVAGPLVRIDWRNTDERVMQLAGASGGAVYHNVRTLTSSAIFDDILERLRVRYRLTYTSTAGPSDQHVRRIEIRLANNRRTDGRASTHVLARAEYKPSSMFSSHTP